MSDSSRIDAADSNSNEAASLGPILKTLGVHALIGPPAGAIAVIGGIGAISAFEGGDAPPEDLFDAMYGVATFAVAAAFLSYIMSGLQALGAGLVLCLHGLRRGWPGLWLPISTGAVAGLATPPLVAGEIPGPKTLGLFIGAGAVAAVVCWRISRQFWVERKA